MSLRLLGRGTTTPRRVKQRKPGHPDGTVPAEPQNVREGPRPFSSWSTVTLTRVEKQKQENSDSPRRTEDMDNSGSPAFIERDDSAYGRASKAFANAGRPGRSQPNPTTSTNGPRYNFCAGATMKSRKAEKEKSWDPGRPRTQAQIKLPTLFFFAR